MVMWPELEWTRLGPGGRRSRPCLVDWCGDLLMVVRYTVFNKIFMSKTASFKALKFDFGRGRWDEIDNLGGDGGSIFVSYSAMAVLSIKEEFLQFKSNKTERKSNCKVWSEFTLKIFKNRTETKILNLI